MLYEPQNEYFVKINKNIRNVIYMSDEIDLRQNHNNKEHFVGS